MDIVLASLLIAWLAGAAVCLLKGRPVCALGPVFAVARLARPGSWWARHFYGDDKLAQAQWRYAVLVRGYPR